MQGSRIFMLSLFFIAMAVAFSSKGIYTASFGLFFYKVNEQLSIEKAYVYADQLLLQSKDLGKNRLSSSNAHDKLFSNKNKVVAEV
jgi:hypothetical protein